MKKNILAFIIIIFPIILIGQDWEVYFGETYKIFNKKKYKAKSQFEFLGLSDHSYFLTHKSKRGNELLQFDFKHKLINVIAVGKNSEGNKLKAELILKTKNQNYLISSYYKKKERQAFIYATPFKQDGRLAKTKEPLLSYSDFKLGSGLINNDAYGFDISPDSSKIVFTKGISNLGDSKKNEQYQVLVFDENLNKIWDKKVPLSFADKKIQFIQFGVTNSGEVFLLTKEKRFAPISDYWIPNKDYVLLRIKPEEQYKIDSLILKESSIIDVVVFSKNDDLYVSGIYTNGVKKIGANGLFMMKFGADDQLLYSKKYRFEDKIKQYLIPSPQKNKETIFYNFKIGDLLVDYPNGNFTLVAENRYLKSSEDIIVAQFSFDGVLNWVFHKDKTFHSDQLSRSAFGLSHSNGNIFLIYNLFKSKKEKKEFQHQVKPNWSSSYTDVIKINEKGEAYFEETIFHSRELKHLNYPVFTKKIYDGNMLLFFAGERFFQYGTLIFR